MIKKTINLAFLFLLTVSFTHCRTNRERQREREYKAIYIDQFKLTYFRQMLIKSYNNSNAIQEIINSDHSGFTEPILTDNDYALIDSLTTNDNVKMKVDSTEGSLRGEGAQGKRPLEFILDKLNSKWLNSVVDKQYKISAVKEMYKDD